MIPRLGRRCWAWLRARTGSASTAGVSLGLLVCLCTLLAVAGPRAAAQLRTSAFRQLVAAAPATDKTVAGEVSDPRLGVGEALGLDAGLIERARDQLYRNLLTLPLSPRSADWSSLTTPYLAVTGYGPSAMAAVPPMLELSYRDALAGHVRVIAGRMPDGRAGSGSTADLDTAVSEATARRFGLRVGSRLALPATSITLAVTAVVQPRDPASSFWTVDPVLATPQLQNSSTKPYWLGGFFIAAAAVRALQSEINVDEAQVTWVFPVALGRLTAAQAAALQPALAGALATAGHVTVRSGQGGVPIPVPITLSSGTGQLIAGFNAEAASVGSVLDLLSVSLAVLAAVVVLLAGWLLAERRRLEFAVLRARGAARRQLAFTVLGGSAIAAIPGAAIGAGVAVTLTPAAPVPLSWWLAGLVVLASLGEPVLITVRTHRGYAAVLRPDQPPGRLPAARRLVVEAGLVLGAAGGLLVLRYQGLGAVNSDVYPSAAPVLLAIGVAVIVLRVYPLLVRWVQRLTGPRAGATAFLGLARAARVSVSATLPAFAMVLALALVSFSGMVRGALLRGETAVSWQQAGADAVIVSARPVSQRLDLAVAAVPGVQHLVAAALATATASGGRQFDVLAVDPSGYAALTATTPLPRSPSAFTAAGRPGAVPALASSALAVQLGSGPVSVLIADRHIRARVIGRAASMSAVPDLSDGYLVLPRRALGNAVPLPSVLLVGGPDLDRAALEAAVSRYGPGSEIVLRSRLLAGLQSAPLARGANLTLALGAVAAACCCLLVLLLSLLLSARSRQLSLARMTTMGLSAAQGRLLGLIEQLPQLVAVLAGGLACAAALVPLIGPALSLAVFTGSSGNVPVRIEPAWLAATAAGLLVLAGVTLAGQTMLADHNPARSLRMGE